MNIIGHSRGSSRLRNGYPRQRADMVEYRITDSLRSTIENPVEHGKDYVM